MKKSLCFILAIISLIAVFSISASADTNFQPIYGRTSSPCYLRSAPESASDDVYYIYSNETVVIFGETGNWYKIMYEISGNENFGYLLKTKVKKMYTATTSSDLNVRTSTNTDSETNIVGQFNDYQSIFCIGERMENGWYQVEGDDKNTHVLISGYSAGDYITITGLYSYLGHATFPENLIPAESEPEEATQPEKEETTEENEPFRTEISSAPTPVSESRSFPGSMILVILVVGIALVVAIVKTKNA